MDDFPWTFVVGFIALTGMIFAACAFGRWLSRRRQAELQAYPDGPLAAYLALSSGLGGFLIWLQLGSVLGARPKPQAGFEYLRGCAGLTILGLGDTNIRDRDLEYVRGLMNLRSLDLSRTRITDAGLERIAALTHLEKLIVAQTAVTDAGITKLQTALPNLHIVH